MSTFSKNVLFRTDHSGNEIAIRPNQFLALIEDDGTRLAAATRAIRAEIGGFGIDSIDDKSQSNPDATGGAPIASIDRVRGSWFRVTTSAEVDVIRYVRGLRMRGVPAQPVHVYFVNSLGFNPNFFAPNFFAPNFFAPNFFAPNFFAPNFFAASGGSAACCCPRGLSDDEDRPLPDLAAEPVEAPAQKSCAASVENQNVEVHVVDVASPGPNRSTEREVGELVINPLQSDAIDENSDDRADPAVGHGDFVGSVLEQNSGLKVTLWQAAGPLGDIDDVALVSALQAVDAGSKSGNRRVLNLSLSGYNEDDNPGVVLADQIAAMVADGWLIVASAGNNASCRLAWPAALPGVVAVGAFSNCQPAWFSSYGQWVDASAPGENVVAEFPDLKPVQPPVPVTDELDTSSFSTGWASWSGTSFSAPLVAARLASSLQESPSALSVAEANEKALFDVIGDPDLGRVPNFGTIVT